MWYAGSEGEQQMCRRAEEWTFAGRTAEGGSTVERLCGSLEENAITHLTQRIEIHI
jgi:hypothetical protein